MCLNYKLQFFNAYTQNIIRNTYNGPDVILELIRTVEMIKDIDKETIITN